MLYDSDITYNQVETYDSIVTHVMKRKDLYVNRGSDFTTDYHAINEAGEPVDLTGYTVSGKLYEYSGTAPTADIQVTIQDAVGGYYQLSIDDAVKLIKPRYVYDVHMVSGNQKLLLQHGQILVE